MRQLEEGFQGLFPIWDWTPVAVYLFLLGIDFGAIMVIRRALEGSWYLGRWWSFRIGDTLGLPVYGAFASIVVSKGDHPGMFYNQTWWQLLVLGVGFFIALLIQWNNYRTGFYNKEAIFNPSEMYHTVIYGVMFYFVASSLFPLVHEHDPLRPTFQALVGLAIWIGCVVVDMSSWQDRSPERDRKAFWELFPRSK